MKSDILIIDFDDSFTYNIAEVVSEFSSSVEVRHFQNFSVANLRTTSKQAIILGPGPGHPSEYFEQLKNLIETIKSQENIYLMGVCLGHQLLSLSLGLKIERAQRPIHGESFEVECFDGKKRLVQFYNSLCVKGEFERSKILMNQSAEIHSLQDERMLSYQFHPESVGTSYPSYFFGSLRDFLYN